MMRITNTLAIVVLLTFGMLSAVGLARADGLRYTVDEKSLLDPHATFKLGPKQLDELQRFRTITLTKDQHTVLRLGLPDLETLRDGLLYYPIEKIRFHQERLRKRKISKVLKVMLPNPGSCSCGINSVAIWTGPTELQVPFSELGGESCTYTEFDWEPGDKETVTITFVVSSSGKFYFKGRHLSNWKLAEEMRAFQKSLTANQRGRLSVKLPLKWTLPKHQERYNATFEHITIVGEKIKLEPGTEDS